MGCKLLSRVDIKKCHNIDDIGMISLANSSQNLRQINLSYSSVTDVGLLSLASNQLPTDLEQSCISRKYVVARFNGEIKYFRLNWILRVGNYSWKIWFIKTSKFGQNVASCECELKRSPILV
ncbi:F-box/LRR-repeat protein 3 [Quillaja saponaria]|uniref:F-box/LRR-repeat protein 3 n=1 Tax=Quillaja saponaria TaxID=32244 RepID=A0AAD7LMZ8_QUISA|nr:F-box/LRR-repeat protein 3 [Quillaja saponaria]